MTLTAEPAMPQVAQRGLFQAQFPEPDKLDLLIARLTDALKDLKMASPKTTVKRKAELQAIRKLLVK